MRRKNWPMTHILSRTRHRPISSAGLINQRNHPRKDVKPFREVAHENMDPCKSYGAITVDRPYRQFVLNL